MDRYGPKGGYLSNTYHSYMPNFRTYLSGNIYKRAYSGNGWCSHAGAVRFDNKWCGELCVDSAGRNGVRTEGTRHVQSSAPCLA